MKATPTAVRSCKRMRRQSGVAAIELAFLLPILLVFLTFPIFFARCYWHYTVTQKAAQDAARFLSTVPRTEMFSEDLARASAALAVEIANRELAELAPGSTITGPTAYCDENLCSELGAGTLPATVRIRITYTMSDPEGEIDFGWFGLRLTANYTLPYVGT